MGMNKNTVLAWATLIMIIVGLGLIAIGIFKYREVSAWLTTQSGKSISHMGLKKRVDLERKRKTTARIKRELAKRLQEAITQYETLEKERTGYHTCPAE